MKSSHVCFGVLAILGVSFLISGTQAKASPAGWIQIEKIAYNFQDIVRVELQGVVTFPAIPDVRVWALEAPCGEVHEITLNPHRESGNRASQKLQSKMSPFSITLTGVRAETKGTPVSEMVFCKKFEATGQTPSAR